MKRKVVWIIVALLAVTVLSLKLKNTRDYTPEATVSPTPAPTAGVRKPAPQKTPTAGTAEETIVYSEAVKQYAGSHIQFDVNCQAIPAQTTFKNGSKVLFDNRSGDARTIKIGDVSYDFPGYGFKILTLSSSTLPKELSLHCGSAVNVGSILIQN